MKANNGRSRLSFGQAPILSLAEFVGGSNVKSGGWPGVWIQNGGAQPPLPNYLPVQAYSGRRIDRVTWRSVLGDLIVRCVASRIAAPNPTMPVRDHLRVENPAGSGRHQALPLHDKHVFDTHVGLHGAGTAKTGLTGRSRNEGSRENPISARNSGFIRGILLPGPPLPLGAISAMNANNIRSMSPSA